MRRLASLLQTTLLALPLYHSGCKCADDGRANTERAPAPARSGVADTVPSTAAKAPLSFPIPTGPRLVILAGHGVGPIRIGATVATIERHMQAPCEYVDDSVCRYIGRAIEFHLKDGITENMTIHRRGRVAGKDKTGKDRVYGIFNGAIPPDLQPGMVPQAIAEYLGTPEKVDRVKANQYGTEEIHHYPGMRLEYDRLPNGKLALGGIVLFKDPRAKLPTAKPQKKREPLH